MSASFFEELAAQQMPAPVKRKLDAAEKRRAAAKQAEQDLKDEQTLSKLYRQWKQAKRDALLSGRHGKEIKWLISFIDKMTLSSAPALIKVVQDGRGWMQELSADDRHTLLGVVGLGIARCREKAGLPTFDDHIPFAGEPEKAFHTIKNLLEVA